MPLNLFNHDSSEFVHLNLINKINNFEEIARLETQLDPSESKTNVFSNLADSVVTKWTTFKKYFIKSLSVLLALLLFISCVFCCIKWRNFFKHIQKKIFNTKTKEKELINLSELNELSTIQSENQDDSGLVPSLLRHRSSLNSTVCVQLDRSCEPLNN